VADERKPADSAPAGGQPSRESPDGKAKPSAAAAKPAPAVPAQPTRATPAPSSSQHDRNVAAAAEAARVERTRFARAAVAAKTTVVAIRTRAAEAIWFAAVLAAIALSLGALLIALGANQDNMLVSTLLDLDRAIDGPFWRVFDFYKETKSGGQGPPDEVKNHLVNWGLAAASYLIVGRFAFGVIRPSTR
jgi:hypothetical protein